MAGAIQTPERTEPENGEGDWPIRTCADCGGEFQQTLGGRPRKKCYDCSPPKLDQRKGRPYASRRAEQIGQAQLEKQDRTFISTTQVPAPKLPAKQSTPERHCPQCGTYPDPNSAVYPFCSPQHRAAFAQRVADKKRGGPAPLSVSKQKGTHSHKEQDAATI